MTKARCFFENKSCKQLRYSDTTRTTLHVSMKIMSTCTISEFTTGVLHTAYQDRYFKVNMPNRMVLWNRKTWQARLGKWGINCDTHGELVVGSGVGQGKVLLWPFTAAYRCLREHWLWPAFGCHCFLLATTISAGLLHAFLQTLACQSYWPSPWCVHNIGSLWNQKDYIFTTDTSWCFFLSL